MPALLQPNCLTLPEVESLFRLYPLEDDFFQVWQRQDSAVSSLERQWLDQVRQDGLELLQSGAPQSTIRLAVLGPLFSLAKLYQIAQIRQHETCELLILPHLHIAVLEAEVLINALPQMLFQMMGVNSHQPVFGLLTNGVAFQFVKLQRQGLPQYSLSQELSLHDAGNDLHLVLAALQQIKLENSGPKLRIVSSEASKSKSRGLRSLFR